MSLSPTEMGQLSRLLDEAMDLDPAQAESWMARLATEHEHLLPRLRQMLSLDAARSTRDFLSLGPQMAGGPIPDAAVARAGELVGPYRLIRELGRGGMGSVWLAERADGSLKREVALKLPRLAWDAGLAKRMARERDIGALLAHPNIARLYDAGVDEQGRPFLALEYIDGQPLDAWCETRALDVRECLRLVLQVVRAVAYAHGRLVVHRDLKPANVLVSADGQAHLLDFGIAKLMQEAGDGEEPMTMTQVRVMTPPYASPEQLTGDAITVSSDVYSLGVLLYKVLTGRLPFDSKSLAALEQAVAQADPPSASSRVNDPQRAKALRGEVDAIVRKALQRDPRLRYATADALADDIERHLRGDAVLAQPDSLGYRVAKTLRRHRVGFAAWGAVMLALVAGMGLALLQAQRARAEAERTRVVKAFVVDLFKVNQGDSLENSELRQLPAKALLEHGAGLIEKQFADQPELQEELYGVVAGIFSDMGSAALADTYAGKQIATLSALHASPLVLGDAAILRARALVKLARHDDAKVQAQQVLGMVQPGSLAAARAHLVLASVASARSEYDHAYEQFDLIDRTLAQTQPDASAERMELALLRAECLARQDRFKEAVPQYEAAIGFAASAYGERSRARAEVRVAYAVQLAYEERYDEAKRQEALALAELQAIGGNDDIEAGLARARLAAEMSGLGRPYTEALAEIEQARAALSKRQDLPALVKAKLDVYQASTLSDSGRLEEAYDLLHRALPVLESTGEEASRDDKIWVVLTANLAWTSLYLGDYAGARHWNEEKIRGLERTNGLSGFGASRAHLFLAIIFRQEGRFDEAKAVIDRWAPVSNEPGLTGQAFEDLMMRARLEIDRGDRAGALQLLSQADPANLKAAADRNMATDFHLVQGEALCESGQRRDGLAAFDKFLTPAVVQTTEFDPDLARTRALAGLCALASGDRKRAEELAALSRRAFEHQPRLAAYFKDPSRKLDLALAAKRGR